MMKNNSLVKITYTLADGQAVEVEVTTEVAAVLRETDLKERALQKQDKQKSNLFNLDAFYRNMPKKSFTKNHKQHFETLLLYCWLHYWENDEEYWNEYMDAVSPSL